LAVAFRERANADDPKAQVVIQSGVGAVVATREVEIARSANVLPPALSAAFRDDGHVITETDRYHVIEHAERAAIFNAFLAKQDLAGATIYCTRFPCSDCARAIIWSGITRAVFPPGLTGESRWRDAQRAALRMFRLAGIKVRYLDPGPS
jgi:deoxycytidylate deaminase